MMITITNNEALSFIDSVRCMRRAQKDFFRTRDKVLLDHAKLLEQEVDKQLEAWEMAEAWEKARETRPGLFEKG
jgi:hypothetical protein